MLANDVPWSVVPNWGKVSLPQYLDYNGNGKGWPESVIGWHVTTPDKVESILKNGLRASSCSNWTSSMSDRPSAVYFFCARSVVQQNARALLDDPQNVVILKVTIPAKHTGNLFPDNLYNFSMGDISGLASCQYRGNIPPEWITL